VTEVKALEYVRLKVQGVAQASQFSGNASKVATSVDSVDLERNIENAARRSRCHLIDDRVLASFAIKLHQGNITTLAESKNFFEANACDLHYGMTMVTE
jgi:hypothetical protein